MNKYTVSLIKNLFSSVFFIVIIIIGALIELNILSALFATSSSMVLAYQIITLTIGPLLAYFAARYDPSHSILAFIAAFFLILTVWDLAFSTPLDITSAPEEYPSLQTEAPVAPVTSISDDSLWSDCPEPGTVNRFYYNSNVYSGTSSAPLKKTMTVYLPYNYNTNTKYNVLILIPGMDMSDSCYLMRKHEYDHVNYSVSFKNVVDNMICRGDIEPLILVTVNYFGCTDPGKPVYGLDANQVVLELRNDILPYITQHYSTFSEDSSLSSIRKVRDHFGIFGHSYGATMTIKSVISCDMDLLYWYGASSVFNTDISDTISHINSGKYDVFCYCGAGETDEARPQTLGIYRQMIDGCSSLVDGDNAYCVIIPDAGHSEKTFDTALYNCLRLFFRDCSSENRSIF